MAQVSKITFQCDFCKSQRYLHIKTEKGYLPNITLPEGWTLHAGCTRIMCNKCHFNNITKNTNENKPIKT